MNSTTHLKLPIFIGVITLLCGCGQSGKLFLPGQGGGYYRTHEFTSRPTVAVPKTKTGNPT